MRILVAGATGVIGSRVLRDLVAQGHDVFGTSRRPNRLADLATAGASGLVMDALDRDSVERAIGEAAPDAVVHQLTDLADLDFAGNALLRERGTANLVDVCERIGPTRLVAQSIFRSRLPAPNALQ